MIRRRPAAVTPVPRASADDPVASRESSMIEILASWELEGARPDDNAMVEVRRYVRGELNMAQFKEALRRAPLPSGRVLER